MDQAYSVVTRTIHDTFRLYTRVGHVAVNPGVLLLSSKVSHFLIVEVVSICYYSNFTIVVYIFHIVLVLQ